MNNPFIVGNPAPADKFINRKGEIRRAVSLLRSGQSLAFTGEPRSGKTSLLLYLQNPAKRNLYGDAGARLVFYYADSQTWPEDLSPARFWERVLSSLRQEIESDPALLESYRVCQQENYGTFVLEQFIARLREARWHLVLLLDEFDALLQYPLLNHTEFYGGLRSLASRYGEALTLVIGSRRSLSDLNERTQEYAGTGSPSFNFVREIPLPPFTKKDGEAILKQAGGRFTHAERRSILYLAGGHPYLLQIAGDALWNGHEDGLKHDKRLHYVGKELLRVADGGLRDIWRNWTPEMHKVFAIVALDEMPRLLNKRGFNLKALLKELKSRPREVRQLISKGFIEAEEIPAGRLMSGYKTTAQVMLWWLAEELLAALRREDDLGQCLMREEWLGYLKRGERDKLVKAVQGLGKMAQAGAMTFIQAAAAKWGAGL